MKKAHMQAFIDRFRVNANRAAMVQSRIKALQRMAGARPRDCPPGFLGAGLWGAGWRRTPPALVTPPAHPFGCPFLLAAPHCRRRSDGRGPLLCLPLPHPTRRRYVPPAFFWRGCLERCAPPASPTAPPAHRHLCACSPAASPPILSFTDVDFAYPGGPNLFNNLNFGWALGVGLGDGGRGGPSCCRAALCFRRGLRFTDPRPAPAAAPAPHHSLAASTWRAGLRLWAPTASARPRCWA